MKSYDERTESILRKYDERLAAKKRRNSIITRIAVSAGACAAVAAGVFFIAGDDLKGTTEIKQPDTIITEPEPTDAPPEPVVTAQVTTSKTVTTSGTAAATTVTTSGKSESKSSTVTTTSTKASGTNTTSTSASASKTTEVSTETTTASTAETTVQTTTVTTTHPTGGEPVTTTIPEDGGSGGEIPVAPEPANPEPVNPAPVGEDQSIMLYFYRCELLGRSYHYSYRVDQNEGELIGEVICYSTDPIYGLVGAAYFCDQADVSRAIAVAFDDRSGFYIYFS